MEGTTQIPLFLQCPPRGLVISRQSCLLCWLSLPLLFVPQALLPKLGRGLKLGEGRGTGVLASPLLGLALPSQQVLATPPASAHRMLKGHWEGCVGEGEPPPPHQHFKSSPLNFAPTQPQRPPQISCERLQTLTLQNTTFLRAQFVPSARVHTAWVFTCSLAYCLSITGTRVGWRGAVSGSHKCWSCVCAPQDHVSPWVGDSVCMC